MLPGCRGELLFIEVTHGAHYVGLLHLMFRFHTEANAFLILPGSHMVCFGIDLDA